MKILLIYTEEQNDVAGELRALLRQIGIILETIPLRSHDDMSITQFTDFFGIFDADNNYENKVNAPTHVAILSSLSRRWYDFLAGFSCGSRLPILIYGQEAIAGITSDFAPFFIFVKTRASLNNYLETEYEVFKKQEDAREIIKAQETLLGMGVPVNAESLSQCVSEGRMNEISLFLAAGFSPDTRNKAGVPLLNIAARKGELNIVRYLLIEGAQVNYQADDRGTSPLIDSIMAKQHDLAEALIKAGADPNIRSKDGQTALVIAVGAGDEKSVETLLKAGADPDIADSMGVSARKYATLFHKNSIVTLFDTYAPPKSG